MVIKSLRNHQDTWEVFSTLSDAQTVLQEFGDVERNIELINHAKKHLMRIMEDWSDDVMRDAMTSTMKCNLQEN
jgi:uncharacterized protein YjfI (DUF2170 family)